MDGSPTFSLFRSQFAIRLFKCDVWCACGWASIIIFWDPVCVCVLYFSVSLFNCLVTTFEIYNVWQTDELLYTFCFSRAAIRQRTVLIAVVRIHSSGRSYHISPSHTVEWLQMISKKLIFARHRDHHHPASSQFAVADRTLLKTLVLFITATIHFLI